MGSDVRHKIEPKLRVSAEGETGCGSEVKKFWVNMMLSYRKILSQLIWVRLLNRLRTKLNH
jgi:hypothetical protein